MSFEELLRFPLVCARRLQDPQEARGRRRRSGVVLPPSIEAEGREAVREIVASGAGIGFVSRAEFGDDPAPGSDRHQGARSC
jgi:LysR family transcriptional regulator, low CO2-responsive transcriptional regulator